MELMDEGPPPFKKQKTELNEQAEVEEGDGAEDVADSEKLQDEEEATNKTPNQKAGLFITSDTKYTPASSTNLCVFTALAKTRDDREQAYTKRFTTKSKELFCSWFEEMHPEKKVHANKFSVYNKDFDGITPSQLPAFEKFFDVRVELYRRIVVNTTKGNKPSS